MVNHSSTGLHTEYESLNFDAFVIIEDGRGFFMDLNYKVARADKGSRFMYI